MAKTIRVTTANISEDAVTTVRVIPISRIVEVSDAGFSQAYYDHGGTLRSRLVLRQPEVYFFCQETMDEIQKVMETA